MSATVLALVALVSSVLLISGDKVRWFGIIAAIASLVALLTALGWLSLRLPGVPLPLAIALTLAVTGVLMLLKVSKKASVIAATLVTAVGAISLLGVLG